LPSNQKLLLVSSDPHLAHEVRAALSTRADLHFVILSAADHRQGLETARSHQPEFVFVELEKNFQRFAAFIEEVASASPASHVAALFDPHVFGVEVAEGAVLIEAIRAGVRDFLRRPLSSTDLEQFLSRAFKRQRAEPARLGHVSAFISNKGGVGKSTLAVNAACGLAARYPGEVLLIDASLQMGVCASMLDLHPTTSIVDAVRQRDRLDPTLLQQLAAPHASGLHLLASPSDAAEGAEVDDETLSRVLTLARRTYRFVIIDTFPIIDRVVMAVLDIADHVYLVVENVVPTLIGARKLVGLLQDLGISAERQGLIVNRYSKVAGNPRPAEVATQLGMPVDHIIPFHKKAIEAANTGVPFVMSRTWWGPDRHARRLVDEIESLAKTAASRIAGSSLNASDTNGSGTNGLAQVIGRDATTNGPREPVSNPHRTE